MERRVELEKRGNTGTVGFKVHQNVGTGVNIELFAHQSKDGKSQTLHETMQKDR